MIVKRLFQLARPRLAKIYENIIYPKIPNLIGDREVEYSLIAANIPSKDGGRALDFGSANGYLGLLVALKGYRVIAIDLTNPNFHYRHRKIKFNQIDLFDVRFPQHYFNLIINCSTVEHVGLTGRYGITNYDKDGDLKAMKKLRQLLKPRGKMLITLPVGKDTVFHAKHRVYGNRRLPLLIKEFKILKQEFWGKDGKNKWIKTNKKEVLSLEPSEHFYNLGFFVLSPK